MKMQRRLSVIQALIVLFLAVGTGAAVPLVFIGALGVAMGVSGGRISLAVFALFCLGEVIFVGICAWRELTAAYRLAGQLRRAPGDRHALIRHLLSMAVGCALAGMAWLVLISVMALISWTERSTWRVFAAYVLPTPCLWAMALGFHIPAAMLRRTLPETRAVRLPVTAARHLLCAVLALLSATGLAVYLSDGLARMSLLELPACGFFTLGCVLACLASWKTRPVLQTAAGWCFIGCSAGLLFQYVASSIQWGGLTTVGWMEALGMLALTAFPTAVGLGILVFRDMIPPRGDNHDSY